MQGQPVHVIAAGGIFDGRGLAMALALGAQAAWVGTRFVASVEGVCDWIYGESRRSDFRNLFTSFQICYFISY
jgi:dihydroorotate dehydrogenase